MDTRVMLSMADMGMHHEGMDMSGSRAAVNHAPGGRRPHGRHEGQHGHAAARRSGRRAARQRPARAHVLGSSTLGGPIDARDAAREIELHLTGHMERYIWSFNGQKFSDATPLRFAHGERLRVTLVNDTMMTHPIHLHGMWSELSDAHGAFLVRKHTVIVQPAQRLSYLVTADALGSWAYHCHLLYHMEAGMFREVVVA